MKPYPVWVEQIQDKDKADEQDCIVYGVAAKPDGTKVIAATSNFVRVYNAVNGEFIAPLKGHKDAVYCVCYNRDGSRFASGGADKTVIIWTDELVGILKYQHNEAIQSVCYNPVTSHLISCTSIDFGIWSPEQKSVIKHKVSNKITTSSWTKDGQYAALGFYSGQISIRALKGGEERVKIDRPGGAPIWCIAWNPAKTEAVDIMAVADWNQKLSFYQLNGRQVGKDRHLGYDPGCLRWYPGGEYLLIGGSNKEVGLYTKEGIYLTKIVDMGSWAWCVDVFPSQNYIIAGSHDGSIKVTQLNFNTVHGLYKDRYAFRENMTDVIIQNLLQDQKVKIKCRDWVKKVAIYKFRLAVQLPDKIIVYELYSDDVSDMHYRVKDKIMQRFDCNLLVVTAHHILLCKDHRLQAYAFSGAKEREWVLEANIRYIKVIGGPPGKEGLLVGLRSGQVLKIFVDNPFPMLIIKQPQCIRCIDISMGRDKLAIIDETQTCSVYDIKTKKLLFQEPNATSLAWNTHNGDMMCFSSNGYLNIKASNFPVHQRKMQGYVVGFSGSKIFCLQNLTMQAVDVPQSAPMNQYIEKKMFHTAYNVACLGVTNNDWLNLANEALENLNLEVAKNAFTRVRELRYLEFISNIEERKQSKAAETTNNLILADYYAFKGEFQEAAKMYKKSGNEDKAMAMFSDLRQFENAKDFLTSSDPKNIKGLIKRQAEWCKSTNDPGSAIDLFMAASAFTEAIEIAGKQKWPDKLVEIMRQLDKSFVEELRGCALHFKELGKYEFAAESYQKLGELSSLVELYIESHQWQEAFTLCEDHPEFKESVYIPYANFLAENDKFDEAQEAYYIAGKPTEAVKVLEKLTHNAVAERRFDDASYYFWKLSMAYLKLANQAQTRGSEEEVNQYLDKFQDYQHRAEMYYVYQTLHRYTEEPFTSHLPEALFNMARFLLHNLSQEIPYGVSKVSILYALAKQSKNMGAYKMARHAFDKLQQLVIPRRFQQAIDLSSITIRSKPFQDKEELLPMCSKCSTTNPLLNQMGNQCINCQQPFVHSFYAFEVLPLVEFIPENGISDLEAVKLINQDPPTSGGKGWQESNQGDVQTMSFENPNASRYEEGDTFETRLQNWESMTSYQPVEVGPEILKKMPRSEVVVLKWGSPLRYQFYKNLMPDIILDTCDSCNRIFYADDLELQYLQKQACPFCRKSVAQPEAAVAE
ncbi:intraflagellar transport protein 122 homolog isoform X2 [Bolinopsis microptera]|uniref:intraflagellar transport protein 122 homolog isoform X2 n=1 Tax=Bolinopsis microptera TaxID=2820187 RepID=UPI00307AF6DE